jgi:RNA polymerase sigma-70 factor, ECF subfamily
MDAARPQGGVIALATEGDRLAEERVLVRRAQEGDLVAFEQLYRENERRVYALCFRMSSDASLAEELTQDVFIRAWQKLGSFRGESAFSSWLYPIAVNTSLSERRARRRRTSRVFATDDLTPFEKPAAEKSAGPEAGFDLEKALRTLPPGARAVFVLHDVEGYRHQEIAQMTGIATGTSKAQLHRARRLLREALRA